MLMLPKGAEDVDFSFFALHPPYFPIFVRINKIL